MSWQGKKKSYYFASMWLLEVSLSFKCLKVCIGLLKFFANIYYALIFILYILYYNTLCICTDWKDQLDKGFNLR